MRGIFGWIGTLPAESGAQAPPDGVDDEVCTLRNGSPLRGAAHGAPNGATPRCHSDDDCAVLLSDADQGPSASSFAADYLLHGGDSISRLRGPFALALFDKRDGSLRLAIDRVGARSLYVLRRPGLLLFASRLDALKRLWGQRLQISDQAIFEYLYFHMIPSPRTIYTGVAKLLPAQVLHFTDLDSGSPPSEHFYWRMPYEDDRSKPGPQGAATDVDALRAEFRDLLPQAIGDAGGLHSSSPDTVGCFLSGGTDSSTVAGTWRQVRGEAVRTYSMGFAAEGFDEMEYARIAARHFNTTPREYYVTPTDVVEAVPKVVAYCDEPFGNASVVPAFLCARFAKTDGIDVMLAGDGGDEIFGGNERYANQWLFEQYGQVPGPLKALLSNVASVPSFASFAPVRKLQSYITQANVPLPDRLETYNFLHRTALSEIFEDEFLRRVNTDGPLENLREVYLRTGSASSINRMMHLDLKITLADNDLRKVNQACGLAGVEARYPLLDDRILAFAASVPSELHLKRRHLRWFFKRALRDFLPPEIISKRKHGFGLPVGLWMKEHPPLKALADASVASLKQRGIIRPSYIDWIGEQHRLGHASYYGVMLWVLVMLEQWLQRES
jgi:asparagine synthase (glutamine-hydrolysing)